MIGKKIADLLYEQHKTQVWLAQKCGVTKGHINQIISGKVCPSLTLLIKMADVLNTNIEQIINKK